MASRLSQSHNLYSSGCGAHLRSSALSQQQAYIPCSRHLKHKYDVGSSSTPPAIDSEAPSHFTNPGGVEGWVGLNVSCLTADTLPTMWSHAQLSAWHRIKKVH